MPLHMVGNAVMLGLRKVGYLSRDTEDAEKVWYISPRNRKEHFFRIWKGWGIAVEIVTFLEKNDVYGVKLVINNTGTPEEKTCKMEVETSTFQQLRLEGHEERYQGFEPQLIMAEKHWLCRGQMML